MLFSGAWGRLINEENLKQKISWHYPFNTVAGSGFQLASAWFIWAIREAVPAVYSPSNGNIQEINFSLFWARDW